MAIGLQGTVTAITKAGAIVKAGKAAQVAVVHDWRQWSCAAVATNAVFVTDECLALADAGAKALGGSLLMADRGKSAADTMSGSGGGGGGSGSGEERVFNVQKQESPIWKGFENGQREKVLRRRICMTEIKNRELTVSERNWLNDLVQYSAMIFRASFGKEGVATK